MKHSESLFSVGQEFRIKPEFCDCIEETKLVFVAIDEDEGKGRITVEPKECEWSIKPTRVELLEWLLPIN